MALVDVWNWVRAGGIQQLSEWPRIRHSWVHVSDASARAFCRFTSMAADETRQQEDYMHELGKVKPCNTNHYLIKKVPRITKLQKVETD